MTRFAVHGADDGALEFLGRELAQGHTLLRELGELVRKTPGHCSVYAPVGISADRLRRDRNSSLAFEPSAGDDSLAEANAVVVAANSQELAAALALERLTSMPESLLVVEDAVARRDFPAEHRNLHDKLYCEDRIYRIVAGSASPRLEDVLQIVLASASSFNWAIACCKAARSRLPEPEGEIASADLSALGNRATWLALELYDGDGLLTWTRA